MVREMVARICWVVESEQFRSSGPESEGELAVVRDSLQLGLTGTGDDPAISEKTKFMTGTSSKLMCIYISITSHYNLSMSECVE